MVGETGVIRSIIDELHSSDIERDQIEDEIGVTWIFIDEYHSLDILRDQMECGSGVTRGIIE